MTEASTTQHGTTTGDAPAERARPQSRLERFERDHETIGHRATIGLSVVMAGGVVFVRSSMTEFLRFWMLRLVYEQQRDERGDS